jgi:hypothetical protein
MGFTVLQANNVEEAMGMLGTDFDVAILDGEYCYGSQRNAWRAKTRPPASWASTTQSPSAPGASVLRLCVRQLAVSIGSVTEPTVRPWCTHT